MSDWIKCVNYEFKFISVYVSINIWDCVMDGSRACVSVFRSFGVVLWELLTGEIPYKDVDSSAIIWGVGSNSLHLPVPSTCPDGFKILMKQTW